MNTLELAAKVLAKASTFDNRKAHGTTDTERAEAQRLTITTWAEALDADVTEADALRAVTQHYAQTRDWMMPADINRLCRAMRHDRVLQEEQRSGHLIPDGLGDTPLLEARWRKEAIRAIGMGATRQQAGAHAWQRIGRTPPDQMLPAPTRTAIEGDTKHGPTDPKVLGITNQIGATA